MYVIVDRVIKGAAHVRNGSRLAKMKAMCNTGDSEIFVVGDRGYFAAPSVEMACERTHILQIRIRIKQIRA